MKRSFIIRFVIIAGYALFVVLSLIIGFDPGKQIGNNFIRFFKNMVFIIPCAFILIGLFEIWVKKEAVERHLGEECGLKGYVWAILLSGTTVGGLYVAFPVAYSLYNKGAKLAVIFTYLGASAICRIPMTLFETSFLGIEFTLVRLAVSLPLLVITSMLMGEYLTKRGYKIIKGK